MPEPQLRTAGSFDALRIPNFRILFCGTLFSFTAFFMSTVVNSIVAFEITGTNGAVGSAVFGQGLGMFLFGPLGGAYADRQQRYMTNDAQRRVMDSQGYALRTGADAQMRSANAEYLGVEQRPELQRSQIASDEKMEGMRQAGAINQAKVVGDYGIRRGQLDVAAAREQAQATRDATTRQLNIQRQMMLDQPIVTESGIVRRGKGGAYEMDAFENPSALDEAEAAYQKAGALHKVWKDPLRALTPWYDPKLNE